MSDMFTSTIAAVSTPRGKGGIAVIRISGPDTLSICEKFIHPKSRKPLSSVPANTAVLALVSDPSGETLDEAIVIVFRAPHSYTGEDTVEISCHGGILLTEEILSSAFVCGAVPAGPGEFTRRAFAAGKLSLSEAEAVIGVIEAQTHAALKLSRKNMEGAVRRRTDEINAILGALISSVYAVIDFPDEDLAEMTREELREGILRAKAMLETLSSSYRTGHAVCEGIRTVIFGKPNTGKSTILNLLAGKDRAIVTDIAGTTRDVICETVVAGEVLLRLFDTAGIRESADAVERLGVSKSMEALDEAELILAVFDASRPLEREDEEVLSRVCGRAEEGAQLIVIMNKSDLPGKADVSAIQKRLGTAQFPFCAKDPACRTSLVSRIEGLWKDGSLLQGGEAVIANARQFSAAEKALSHASEALLALDALGPDIACTELEAAMASLGELDGRQVTEEIVDQIFHHFCVGK